MRTECGVSDPRAGHFGLRAARCVRSRLAELRFVRRCCRPERATEKTPALTVAASPAYLCKYVQMYAAEAERGSLVVPSVAGYDSYSPTAGFVRQVRPVWVWRYGRVRPGQDLPQVGSLPRGARGPPPLPWPTAPSRAREWR